MSSVPTLPCPTLPCCRDRHLHIANGYVSRAGGPGGPTTAGEVMRLAAVLTQQALPMHYKVTSDGDKQKL